MTNLYFLHRLFEHDNNNPKNPKYKRIPTLAIKKFRYLVRDFSLFLLICNDQTTPVKHQMS